MSSYLDSMHYAQQQIITKAEKIQKELQASNLRKRSLDPKGSPYPEEAYSEFPINSHVLVAYPQGRMGRKAPTKFHMQWKGPMKVINRVGTTYTLHNLVTNKLEDRHVSSLKRYVQAPDGLQPVQVAARDYDEYLVERIIAHRTNNSHLIKDWEFQVRWSGYDPSFDDWVPYKNLRNNEFLHQYLRENHMQTRIPREFR